MVFDILDKIISAIRKAPYKDKMLKMYSIVWALVINIKLLLNKVFFIFRKPVYLHGSDLLYAQPKGLSEFQLIVISRIMDTRLWFEGENPVWHLKLSNNNLTNDNAKSFCDQYVLFLKRIHESGFDPGREPFTIFQRPFLGICGGSHRLGYIFACIPNTYIRVAFFPKIWSQNHGENGEETLLKRGVSLDDIERIKKNYLKLWGQMYHSLTACFFEDNDYIDNKQQILDTFISVGTVDEIKENIKIDNGKCNVTLVRFSLNYQDFYYSRGKLRSKVVETLRYRIDKEIGLHSNYVIADSVTDSIALENDIIENRANC